MSYAEVTRDYESQEFGPVKRRRMSQPGAKRRGVYRGAAWKHRASVPPSVRTYVKSAITRTQEVKKSFRSNTDYVFGKAIANSQCNPLMPAIAQGTGQASRIGNSIRIKKVTLRMMIHLNPQASLAPLYVDTYIFKQSAANDTLTTVDTSLLQDGNGSIPYEADTYPYCGMLAMNEEMFIQKKHMRKLLFNPNTTQTGYQSAFINPTCMYVVDITPYFKKTLTYNDTASTVTNDNLWLAVGCSTSNASLGTATAGEYSYVVEYEYYDN